MYSTENGTGRADGPRVSFRRRVYDAAVVGGGLSGLATAARLQARGLSTIVLEAHAYPGGCAGFFTRSGFSFDVGATTLVDFEPGGVGGEFLEEIGMQPIEGETLSGYRAWLPDRLVTLYRDPHRWAEERLRSIGNTAAHRRLWRFLDRLASVFWKASRRGLKLPIRGIADVTQAVHAIGVTNLPLVRYARWTMGDALRAYGLRGDRALTGLLSMLIEDTVHSTVDRAPLINAALGISIGGAGLTRANGGMRGFLTFLVAHYRKSGGELRLGCVAQRISTREGCFRIQTRRGTLQARQVVSSIPVNLTARIAPPRVSAALKPYLRRNWSCQGGAIVVFLGVPKSEVSGQSFTHHQILEDYAAPLGNGNNMFVSVSAPGDTESAPSGFRSVMVSTHCELAPWRGLQPDEYRQRKHQMGERLLGLARRVYPNLGSLPMVCEIGTPRTYEKFTRRPSGAVGGFRLHLKNSNQSAVPHDVGLPGFWCVGDTTWPGLGTVACVLGSRIVANGVTARHERRMSRPLAIS